MNAPCSGAPLTAPHVTTEGLYRWKAINKEGRHVGLDFYDLLIEGDYTHDPARIADRGSMSDKAIYRQLCSGCIPSRLAAARFFLTSLATSNKLPPQCSSFPLTGIAQ